MAYTCVKSWRVGIGREFRANWAFRLTVNRPAGQTAVVGKFLSGELVGEESPT